MSEHKVSVSFPAMIKMTFVADSQDDMHPLVSVVVPDQGGEIVDHMIIEELSSTIMMMSLSRQGLIIGNVRRWLEEHEWPQPKLSADGLDSLD